MNGTRVTPLGGGLSEFTLPSGRGAPRLGGLAAERVARVAPLWARPLTTLRALRERLARWNVMARQRRQLARMDERMLKDIGLSRSDAHREARKWFWQV